MKNFARIIAFVLMLTLCCPAALAASATPTPPPVDIGTALVEPPAEIQRMLDIAYTEWEQTNGADLGDKNKFTEWRGKGYSYEWCAGYVTWVMMEAGIPMQEIGGFLEAAKASEDGYFRPEGLYHCKEATPGKFLRAYQIMERATMVPQKGFIVIYGCSFNKTIHAAFVYDVEDLGGGKYRITTLEGNIKNSIKMFVRDYDMNAEVNTNSRKSTNLTEVPEDERTIPASNIVDYTVMTGRPAAGYNVFPYYVNRFLMPWVPGDSTLSTPIPAVEATPAPTAEPTPELTAEPTPAPTAAPTAAPAETAEEAVVVAPVVALTPPPAVTQAPADEAPAPTEAPADEAPVPTEAPAPTAPPAPTEAPTPEPAPGEPTWPCQGKEGNCPYITRSAEDPFCRNCDRNDNGIEDSAETAEKK